MSSAASKWNDWTIGFAAGCNRFVPDSVAADAERARRARLVGLMLVAPFFLIVAQAVILLGRLEMSLLMASFCAVAGLCWLAAVLVALSVRPALLELCTLLAGATVAAAMVAMAGGLAAPASLMVLALALEAWWVRRSRRSLLAGGAMALLALACQPLLPAWLGGHDNLTALQWLVPAAYASTLWIRFMPLRREERESADEVPSIEALVDAVVIRLARGGEVSDVSAQAYRLMRLSPDLLVGSGLFERIHIADRVAYLCALADMRDGADRRRVELRLRLPREAGEERGNYRSFTMEFMQAGEAGTVALLRDNEEMVGLRRDLCSARESADSTEVAKSRFLAAVSHELRTPLNAILGFSDMLLQEMFGGFADPRQKEYVGIIRESGHHLLAVVNSILDVSKMEAGTYTIHPEPFVFAEAVDSCSLMMTHQASAKSLSVDRRFPVNIGEVCADRRAVQQILINLLSNAVKFTPEGGHIEIGARKTGGRLRFWVSDTGIGISEEDLHRLGRPFTQVRNDYTRQFEGTGLGLSLVKGLVSLHQGSMEIESAPGKGTQVTVSLPLDGPMQPERMAIEPAPVDLPANARHGRIDEATRKTA